MDDIRIRGKDDKTLLLNICNQVSQEQYNTLIMGADLFFCIIHGIDYELLNSITYIFITKRNFNRLKAEVVNRYRIAVK